MGKGLDGEGACGIDWRSCDCDGAEEANGPFMAGAVRPGGEWDEVTEVADQASWCDALSRSGADTLQGAGVWGPAEPADWAAEGIGRPVDGGQAAEALLELPGPVLGPEIGGGGVSSGAVEVVEHDRQGREGAPVVGEGAGRRRRRGDRRARKGERRLAQAKDHELSQPGVRPAEAPSHVQASVWASWARRPVEGGAAVGRVGSRLLLRREGGGRGVVRPGRAGVRGRPDPSRRGVGSLLERWRTEGPGWPEPGDPGVPVVLGLCAGAGWPGAYPPCRVGADCACVVHGEDRGDGLSEGPPVAEPEPRHPEERGPAGRDSRPEPRFRSIHVGVARRNILDVPGERTPHNLGEEESARVRQVRRNVDVEAVTVSVEP